MRPNFLTPHYNSMKSLTGRRFQKILALTIVILLCVFSQRFSMASEGADSAGQHSAKAEAAHSEEGGKFNPGNMIIEHVIDAHDWHIAGKGDQSISIPLPVIVYSKQRGLDMFLSSKFHHGHSTYKGYMLEKGKIVAVNETEEMEAHAATVNEEITAGLYDISLTKNAVSLMITCALTQKRPGAKRITVTY